MLLCAAEKPTPAEEPAAAPPKEQADLFAAKPSVDQTTGGHGDHPSRPDREKRGISQAARELKKPGETDDGARKRIARGKKIAETAPEAKDAAQEAGLDDNSRSSAAGRVGDPSGARRVRVGPALPEPPRQQDNTGRRATGSRRRPPSIWRDGKNCGA
ncbi:MAG: hypothetical protein ACLQJR_05855 [Stellaceae bacterium]